MSPTRYATTFPGALKNDTVLLPRSAPEIAIWAADVATTDLHGNWQRVTSDATAAGGVAVHHPDAGAATITTPLSVPTHYSEASFEAQADVWYHIWVRGRAQNDVYTNESVWIQFLDSVTATGSPRWRIGTTEATEVNHDPDGTTLTYSWTFGDGGTSTQASPSHQYTVDSVYQPRVTVTDVEGGRTTARLTVNVSSQTAQQVKFVQWNIHKSV